MPTSEPKNASEQATQGRPGDPCVFDPILDAWKANPAADFPNYAAGSWGPRAAGLLLERDGRKWREGGS